LTLVYRLIICFVVSLFSLLFISSSFFLHLGRFSSLLLLVLSSIKRVTSSLVAKLLLSYLFFTFLCINLLGNVPLNLVPTMFYSVTFSIRLLFWVPLMVCVCYSDFRSFLSHMLPYGSPVGLILFLPLVEIFSQIIRPFTLIVRLRTNLSSGHIIMYIFSYFTLLSSALAPFIYMVLVALFVLELCISALQAYIFVSLLVLYANETV
jgi:F-type H+-transporting ATPase subunit a